MWEQREESSRYLLGQVCVNGHAINAFADESPESNADHCPTCGAETITGCPACKAPIRGHYSVPGVLSLLSWSPSAHCYACGKPYPWTAKRAEALEEVIRELDELPPADRERLQKDVPDIIAETPRSQAAVLRLKKAFGRIGEGAAKVLTDVLTNVATEAVKKGLGL